MANSALAAETDHRGGLGTVRNAVRLLELLGEGPAYQQLSDLAERSGMSLPTVHRLLRSLVLADLAVQDPQSSRYGLGPELSRLSGHYLSRLPVLGALAPYLSGLRDELASTVCVTLLVHGEAVQVDRVDGPGGGPYRDTHRVFPALHTASGRLLAARADEPSWRTAIALVGPAEHAEAETSRGDWAEAGWLALTPPDQTLSVEVAVPVVDGRGVAVAALSAVVHDELEGGNTRVAAVLGRAARAAGRTLGHA